MGFMGGQMCITSGWGSINPEGTEWGPTLKQEYAELWVWTSATPRALTTGGSTIGCSVPDSTSLAAKILNVVRLSGSATAEDRLSAEQKMADGHWLGPLAGALSAMLMGTPLACGPGFKVCATGLRQRWTKTNDCSIPFEPVRFDENVYN